MCGSKHPQINMQSSGEWIIDIVGSDVSTETAPMHLTFSFYGDLDCKKLAVQIAEKTTQIKVN